MNELGLTAFTFYPSEVFASFDLYPCLAETVREKYGMDNDQIKRLGLEASDRQNCFVTVDAPQESLTGWGFETSEKEFCGFFCLEGLNTNLESEAQLICEILSEKYKGLYTTLSLRRENYITKFENEIMTS